MLYLVSDVVRCVDASDTELVHEDLLYRIVDMRPDGMLGIPTVYGGIAWMHMHRFTGPLPHRRLEETALAGAPAPIKNMEDFDPEI